MDQSTNHKDLLTGLPNIAYFRHLSQKVLDDPNERAKGLVFICFDVKNFRAYNYHYGFDAGDQYLVHLGSALQEVFPELFVSRFSDDHFFAVAYNRDLEARLERVHQLTDVEFMGRTMIIRAGIYVVPDQLGLHAVRAYDNAKLACEHLKKSGSARICYYTEELGRQQKLREHIVETLDEALANEYIRVYYQPIVHVLSRRVCGYEGLARWNDPKYGFLSPADFIPTLEDARMIHRLDTFMIHKMCRDMNAYQDRGRTVVPISVNLSAVDFKMTDMPLIAEQAIFENRLPKDFLNVEVTEAAFGDGKREIHDVIDRFRAAGFEIWMDNFGSKYSSLNILEEVEVDLIKVDMKFLREFHTNPRVRTILKNVMNMAKELGVQTLMEGVEDETVLEFLRQTGCEKAQGYLFGRPTPFENVNYWEMNPETPMTRSYYHSIGRFNLLSPTPLQDTSSIRAETSIDELNGIPLAIAEFDGKKFKFLMSNRIFRTIFRDIGVDGHDTPDEIFNDWQLQFAIQIRHSAQQCIQFGNEVTLDFVTTRGFNNIRLKCVAFDPETKVGAILAVVDQIGSDTAFQRERKKESSLKFIYSLYNRVDLIKRDGTEVENIYLNSSRYRASFVVDDAGQSLENFAARNIYPEDRQKFLDFYELSTLEERIWESGNNHITDYFRTRDERRNYSWQMYVIVPVVLSSEKYFLCCARGIDSDRMRRLPEIDRMGTEYYDMPGNPIFLLLASRAFTSTFGYGSFEQFLNNSIYIEANLTANKVLYMHLGKQGIVSRVGYETADYDDMIQDMILNTVVDEKHAEVETFFDRNRLMADYVAGRVVGEMEFLRRPEPNSQPRYLHTSYQLRESNETSDLHVFFLSFDIDAYRRTNEQMVMLIERDNLTGLYNRGTAVNLIREWLENAEGRRSALVILDLDNFKQINDRFGHECGDQILKDAAFRMKVAFKKYGVVARIGGDEFLVLIKDQGSVEIERMLREFSSSRKELKYHEHRITYTMSIGYAVYPDHGVEYQDLYQNADMALYSVKMSGRANYRCFVSSMSEANRTQLGFSISQISEGMPGGFLVYRDNEKQEILFANKKVLEIYECSTLEEFRKFTNNSFRGCVHEADWEFVQQTIAEQLVVSAGYDYVQYRARTANGNMRLIEDFGRLVHSTEDGDIFYVFLIDLENKEKIYHKIIPARRWVE